MGRPATASIVSPMALAVVQPLLGHDVGHLARRAVAAARLLKDRHQLAMDVVDTLSHAVRITQHQLDQAAGVDDVIRRIEDPWR